MIGVVIATLNEADTLGALLDDLRQVGETLPLDVVVADGGSGDATTDLARVGGAGVVSVAPGRGRQMNAGAARAEGEWLLFLHADSRLGPGAAAALVATTAPDSGVRAAVFRFAIDLPDPWRMLVERGQAMRESVLRLPYGDQGLLVRRELFDQVGGYQDLALMEDVALVQALRRHTAIVTLPARLVTSGRRYRAGGVIRTVGLHTLLLALFLVGVSPGRLAALRRGKRASEA